jgi:vacuolar-type H+-ATPase subunit E/Vma4
LNKDNIEELERIKKDYSKEFWKKMKKKAERKITEELEESYLSSQ